MQRKKQIDQGNRMESIHKDQINTVSCLIKEQRQYYKANMLLFTNGTRTRRHLYTMNLNKDTIVFTK